MGEGSGTLAPRIISSVKASNKLQTVFKLYLIRLLFMYGFFSSFVCNLENDFNFYIYQNIFFLSHHGAFIKE